MTIRLQRRKLQVLKALGGHPLIAFEKARLGGRQMLGSFLPRWLDGHAGILQAEREDTLFWVNKADSHASLFRNNSRWWSGGSHARDDFASYNRPTSHLEREKSETGAVATSSSETDARAWQSAGRAIFSQHWRRLLPDETFTQGHDGKMRAGFVSMACMPSVEMRSLGLEVAARRTFSSRGEGVHVSGPAAAYKTIVSSGHFRRDLLQDAVVGALQKLHDELLATDHSSWLGSFLRKIPRVGGSGGRDSERLLGGQPRGIYLHGGVGVGKTMMMDLFYEHTPIKRKKRIHYHPFMLDVHERLHKKKGFGKGSRDPVLDVADQIFKEARLLCLDEVEVTDIADALILLRLFSALWSKGVVLVATSNSPPQDLYKDGLNRHLFLPFIDLLQRHCQVFSLVSEAARDYRRGHVKLQELYIHPLGADADLAMDTAFEALSAGEKAEPTVVPVMMGRKMAVPLAADQVARFSFSALCRSANGAADYLALARRFKGLVIDGIPWMGHHLQENEARRFITLIDVLYEHHNVIACSAEVPLEDIFKPDDTSPAAKSAPKKHSHSGSGSALPAETEAPKLQVVGEGGSSGRSTAMIGGMEWSGTGLPGVSLAGVAKHASFTRKASSRTVSRMLEMQSGIYLARCGEMGQRAMSLVSPENDDSKESSAPAVVES